MAQQPHVSTTLDRQALDLNKISPEYSLERLMVKLKLQYFGHLLQRANSLEKALMLERLREEGEGSERV